MVVHHMLAASQFAGGGYINLFVVLPALLILLVWAKLLTWADKDAVAAHLPRIPLNFGMLAGLIVGYVLFFLLPYWFVVLPLLVVIFGIEAGVYLSIRQQKVGLSDLHHGQFRKMAKKASFKGKERSEGRCRAGPAHQQTGPADRSPRGRCPRTPGLRRCSDRPDRSAEKRRRTGRRRWPQRRKHPSLHRRLRQLQRRRPRSRLSRRDHRLHQEPLRHGRR